MQFTMKNQAIERKFFLAILITILCNININAQDLQTVEWSQVYEGEAPEAITNTSDGGYVGVGGKFTGTFAELDAWIFKIDVNGTLLWSEAYASSSYNSFFDAVEAPNGDIIAVGRKGSDALAVRYDSNGNQVWEQTYGGSEFDGAWGIVEDQGNFVLAGVTVSSDGDVSENFGLGDVWVVKIDGAGNILWEKAYGGTGGEGANEITKTNDGGYAICLESKSIDGVFAHPLGIDEDNTWTLKIDANGTFQWSTSTGFPGTDRPNTIIESSTGDLLVGGVRWSDAPFYKSFIVSKLSANGEIAWQKELDGDANGEVNGIVETPNGDFLLMGSALSNSLDGDLDNPYGNTGYYYQTEDIWLLQLDPNGNILEDAHYGGSDIEYGLGIVPASNGGYVLFAETFSNDFDVSNPNYYDAWMFKIGEAEALIAGCPLTNLDANFTLPNTQNSNDCSGTPTHIGFNSSAQVGAYTQVNGFKIGETYCVNLAQNGANHFFTVYNNSDIVVADGIADGTICFEAFQNTYKIQLNLNDGDCGTASPNQNAQLVCTTCPPLSACTDPTAINYFSSAICDDGSCYYAPPTPTEFCPLGTPDSWSESVQFVDSNTCFDTDFTTINASAFGNQHTVVNDFKLEEMYCFKIKSAIIGDNSDIGGDYFLSIYDSDDNIITAGPADGTLCFTAIDNTYKVQFNLNDGNCGIPPSFYALAARCVTCPPDAGCMDPTAVNYNPDVICDDESCLYGPAGLTLDLNVFLEGPYNQATGTMNTHLKDSNLIPSTQPYNQAPWNYNGSETANSIPANAVDWVLVELRTGTPSLETPATSVSSTQAALLLSDGSVVDPATQGNLVFESISSGNYYVVIRHRNHLDIMSGSSISPVLGNATFDFTTGVSQAFGPSQLKILSNGKTAAYAADMQPNGVIQTTDYDIWFSNNAAVSVYEQQDGNLDGVIQATDYDLWFLNKSKIGLSELQLD